MSRSLIDAQSPTGRDWATGWHSVQAAGLPGRESRSRAETGGGHREASEGHGVIMGPALTSSYSVIITVGRSVQPGLLY